MPEEIRSYLFAEELSGNKDGGGRVKEAKEILEARIIKRAEEVVREAIPFPPELEALIGDLKRWYEEEYYQHFGIEEVGWPRYILRVQMELKDRGVRLNALTKTDMVIIKARGDSDQEGPLDRYFEALDIAHDLYHAAAPTEFITETRKAIFSQRRVLVAISGERRGLSYARIEGGDNAVEEGLAERARLWARGVIDRRLPEGAELFRQKLASLNPPIPLGSLDTAKLEERMIDYGYIAYPKSLKLVNYLMGAVPDFLRLAERARLKHETIALARAIEKVFGKGRYTNVMSIVERQALEARKWLEKEARKKSRKEKIAGWKQKLGWRQGQDDPGALGRKIKITRGVKGIPP